MLSYIVIGICILLLLLVIYVSAKPIGMGIEARRNIKNDIEDEEEIDHLDTKEERIRLIKETPNILGAHAGGNWESRRQSHKDVVSFFQKYLLS